MAQTTNPGPFFQRVPRAHPAAQPFTYPLAREWAEPDWTRLPGFRGVTRAEWETAQWQRAHTVKNLRQLVAVFGELFPNDLLDSIEKDQAERATMSMLLPPQMLNTMDTGDLWSDPVRRYMLPAFDDRDPEWPSHPLSTRDSLHEADMWAVEGLTHRYPTKVLAELLPTCPQYCGHCTRMDLVGNSTPQVAKYKFEVKQPATPRSSTTCAAPPASATWSCPAGTWPTCPSGCWSSSSRPCSTSTASATSAWPPRA